MVSCQVDGKPTPTVQWKKNGENFPINGTRIIRSGTNLVFRSLVLDDTALYDCVVTNRAGTAKASVDIKVEAKTNGKYFL